jgi:hypothetical protein
MIYGLSGMVSDMDELGVKVDYGKSCVQLFTEVARKLLEQGHVDLLALSQTPKSVTSEDGKKLPSWVPDWTSSYRGNSVGEISEFSAPFNVSGSKQAEINVEGYEQAVIEVALVLKGTRVDQVEVVGTQMFNSSTSTEPLSGLIMATQRLALLKEVAWACEESVKKGNKIYPSLERQRKAAWRVPIGDTEQSSGATPATLRATEKSGQGHKLALSIYTVMDKVRKRQETFALMNRNLRCQISRSNH